MPKEHDFLQLTVSSIPSGDAQFYVLTKHMKGLSLMEKAYCAALFELLAKEFSDELQSMVGEERAYLLKEYQKISIVDLRNALLKILTTKETKAKDKGLGDALNHIKEVNQDLEGFSEEDQA